MKGQITLSRNYNELIRIIVARDYLFINIDNLFNFKEFNDKISELSFVIN